MYSMLDLLYRTVRRALAFARLLSDKSLMSKFFKTTQYGLYQVYTGLAHLAGADDAWPSMPQKYQPKNKRRRVSALDALNADMARLRDDASRAEAKIKAEAGLR